MGRRHPWCPESHWLSPKPETPAREKGARRMYVRKDTWAPIIFCPDTPHKQQQFDTERCLAIGFRQTQQKEMSTKFRGTHLSRYHA